MYFSNTRKIISLVRNRISLSLLLLLLLSVASCVVIENQYTALAPGLWRGQLILDQSIPAAEYDEDAVIQDIDETILPVMFEVNYLSEGKINVIWINGSERIVSDSVIWGRDKETGKDSIRIEFPVFDSHISALYEERVIEGYWELHYKENYRIPFVAFFGQSERFKRSGKKPVTDLTGRWNCKFEAGTDDQYDAIGEFIQDGEHLAGTFLTETGDYRYLEGIVQGNEFKLSCFDGAHAFLFEGKISGQDSIQGTFLSGKHYSAFWTGLRDDTASLRDPLQINFFDNREKAEFKGLDLKGDPVSTFDRSYADKSKVIILMGTWCPNCRDANNFIKGYLSDHPGIQDSIIFQAIAFEAYKDNGKNLAALEQYVKKMELPYPVWLGGNKDKDEASRAVKVLDQVKSYPTMIFLDKDDKIRYVHTGFNGPATSEYKEFVSLFQSLIDDIK